MLPAPPDDTHGASASRPTELPHQVAAALARWVGPGYREARYLVACSGGADSTALALACAQLGLKFALAHYHHQLRGPEADGDAEFVAQLARQLGVCSHSGTGDVAFHSYKHRQSISEAARHLRYEWLEQAKSNGQYAAILTAHHADDQAETLFYHLFRQGSHHPLAGTAERWGDVVRPLLGVRRSEILAWLAEQGQTWREDSSNASDKYLRNYIRLRVWPLLARIHPDPTAALNARLAGTLAQNRLLSQFLQTATLAVLGGTPHDPTNGPPARIWPNPPILAGWPQAELQLFWAQFGRTVLRLSEPDAQRWAATATAPPNGPGVFRANQLCYRKQTDPATGQPFWLSDLVPYDHPAYTSAISIRIHYSDENTPSEECYYGDARLGVWLPGALGEWRLVTLPPNTQPDFAQPDVFWLAVPAEAFNLTWRRWQPGDKIQLLGASGSRKVARILSELKVPALQRVDTRALVDCWGQVLWLENARNAECTRVTYPLPAGLRLLCLSKRNANLGFLE